VRRPLFWVLVAILGAFAYMLSAGEARVSTGDSDTGGKKAWITSMFAMAQWICVLVFLFHSFFVAVAAGMVVIRDDEERVGDLLHSTPLTTREYVWGKWLGVLASFLLILAAQLAMHAVCNHLLTGSEKEELVGPFALANYVVPALIFGVPTIVLVAGVSYAIGLWTRKPIPVFFFPAALLLLCLFFLWGWNPSWLQSDHPGIDRLLMWIDPAGLRWLRHTWLDVDRGVDFYNHEAIGLDAGFAVSRGAMIALGLLAVHLAERRFHATLRGSHGVARAVQPEEAPRAGQGTLAGLGMGSKAPGLVAGALEVARVELRGLRSQPGLYLFVPLILLQVITNALVRVGPFDTPLLSTSGSLAAEGFNTLSLLVCLLLLFYTVESLERERSRGLDSIYYATPARTTSILFGKSIANSAVGAVIVLAAFLASAIALAVQGKAPIELSPFALLWGVVLVPTFFAWTSFVAALHALIRNRFASYAVAFGVLAFTGYRQMTGEMNWVGNWNLWNSVSWSDLGPLEIDREALVWNRVLFLSLGVALTVFAVKLFPRRDLDASTVLLRLRPLPLLRSAARSTPLLAVPLLSGAWLFHLVDEGRGGDGREKREKDYWRKNLATWRDAKSPTIVDAVLDIELEPERSFLRVRGEYQLVNDHAEALKRFAVTPDFAYEEFEWKLDGVETEPEDRSGLRVFELKRPLEPGAKLAFGFAFEGECPSGVSKNGGGASEFVLPSGVVLTAFSSHLVPRIGFVESIGIDDENRYDAKEYPSDFYVGETRSGLGNNSSATTRITVRVPDAYLANSVGVLEEERIENGVRTCVWRSDYPVEFFNVVCGKWEVRRGRGTAIYYHPEHVWNVDEMLEALDGAREHYSRWFHPFPWQELKLSEFAAHAGYAQGFPTNITFSEGIGFLAESDPRSRVAFLVTAHEAAHQWWGNLLNPGEGPGGNILSEGMSHFSTMLLAEEVRGLRERIEFCRRIESRYSQNRQVDSEKPLVWVDGSRAGDTTVTYDKGGWVFWMLLQHMGRENALAGLQAFIRKYHGNRDHPVLQDFVASMREFAPDAAAFDAFTQQWFFEVVVPEYALSEAEKRADGSAWLVTVRIENKGTGRMPIEVCAARGERFPENEADALSAAGTVQAAQPDEAYHDVRERIELGAGESRTLTLHCDFEPERVLVDPDALVLQLRRERASVEL
jgi:ABC-type transport system involved in multi-copper enzyme maturation permease subunit/phage-related protein